MKDKFKKGKILKIIMFILPAIILMLYISFSSSENNQEKDQNSFDYYQP
tara:strand:- start:384 stop:530 length:147 start_codon:yes stop_codon:yes gene_type:complete